MESAGSGGSSRTARQIALYFGLLALTVGMGSAGGHGAPAGLASLPIKVFLKDRLHLGPEALAGFVALVSIPLYCGSLFGFLRDRWRPRGWGDRGYMLLAAPVVAGCYLWLAADTVDYRRLLVAILVAVTGYQLLNTASGALMTTVAQQRCMTGRLGSLASLAAAAPAVLASLAGGYLAAKVPARSAFILAACLPLLVLAQAFWKPRAVFGAADAGGAAGPRAEATGAMIRRLAGYRPLWPAAAICLLWDFAPGWGTPLFFHLTNGVGISPAAVGVTDSVSAACTAAGAVCYGFFCQRLPFTRLLRWSLLLGILCGPLYILIGSVWQAVAISVVVGLLQGFTNAGFRGDLLMRSCPRGLEGTGRMLGISASAVAIAGGDLFGAWLFARGGFALCLIITTCTTAIILPLLFCVPRSVAETREGGAGHESAPGRGDDAVAADFQPAPALEAVGAPLPAG